jgi:glycosyltransferase involved in cell wall biosynthesis
MIKEAMSELADEGVGFRFDLVENVPHREVLERISGSHMLIDQVLPGTKELPSIIGMASLEAMARGKAAVSTFDHRFRSFYPECPVVAIDYGKAALKDAVRQLVGDMDRTRKLGGQGRKYVADHHSPKVIGDRVMAVYEEALE